MLRPEVAKKCIEEYKYSSPNIEAVKLLSKDMQNNSILVPTEEVLKQGEFTRHIGNAIHEYEKYWEMLKAQ